MKYRQVELLGLTTISADGTTVIDLDMADPISEIYIDHRVTNVAGTNTTGHPMDSLTKIEIVDGSDVIYNLNGRCAHALDIYHAGMHPRGGWFNYLGGTDAEEIVALSFGRFLWDPELALDPKKFRNPQLKLTYDVSAGGLASISGKVIVTAALFDEKVINPIGFLMSKEIKRWSGVASTHEYTDMPVDFPYRKMLYQGYKDDSPPIWIGANIKLSEDQDKRVVFNDSFAELINGIGSPNSFIREILTCAPHTSATYKHVTPTLNVMAAGSPWSAALGAKDLAFYGGDGGYLAMIAEVTGENIAIHIAGQAPHGVLCIPFGLQNEIDDWYDVANIGSLRADVTGGVTTTDEKIFAQQLRRY